MHFNQAKKFAMHRSKNKKKLPFTRREHVNHVFEGH